jgi:hypothetical protein
VLAPRVRSRRAWWSAAAAAVLVTVALWSGARDDVHARAGAALRRGRIADAAKLLGRECDPFWPVAVRRSAAQRSAARALTAPRGTCFDARPAVRFGFDGGVGPYRVTVFDESGNELGGWDTEETSCSWSVERVALVPGAVYTLRIEELGRRGPAAIGSFTCASSAQQDELTRALDALAALHDGDVRTLQRARARARLGDIEGAARELVPLVERGGAAALRELDSLAGDPALSEALRALTR